MLTQSPAPKWCYRPVWVLLLLFVVLGPLGLPYLWKSPGFSRGAKVVLTVLVAAYTVLLVGETMHAYRIAAAAMGGMDF
jgi:hypothetical protein